MLFTVLGRVIEVRCSCPLKASSPTFVIWLRVGTWVKSAVVVEAVLTHLVRVLPSLLSSKAGSLGSGVGVGSSFLSLAQLATNKIKAISVASVKNFFISSKNYNYL